ncbi:MAG: hypothetical protein GY856_01740, partial [bacterium]|nr:hypothetical protein [bacterium]
LPVKVLGALQRGKFLAAVRENAENEKLLFPQELDPELAWSLYLLALACKYKAEVEMSADWELKRISSLDSRVNFEAEGGSKIFGYQGTIQMLFNRHRGAWISSCSTGRETVRLRKNF